MKRRDILEQNWKEFRLSSGLDYKPMSEKAYKFMEKAMEEYRGLNKVLTEEIKTDLILRKFHGHTKEQWENELVKEYPFCELPFLVKSVWEEAQK